MRPSGATWSRSWNGVGSRRAPALASGQTAAAEWEGRLLYAQAFEAGPAVGWLSGQMTASRREGFPGLRVAVDMSWALRPVTGVEQLPDFERGIAAAVTEIAARFVLLGAGKVAGVIVETVDDA